MKHSFTASLIVLVACLLAGHPSFHSSAFQSDERPKPALEPKPTLPLAPLRRDFKGSLPIPEGEKLEYEIRFTRFPIHATVGAITFEYLGEMTGEAAAKELKQADLQFEPAPEERFFHLRASAISKGILIAILGVDVNDHFETLVDADDFSARLGLKEVKEGKKHTAQIVMFNRSQKLINLSLSDLKNPQSLPREKVTKLKDGALDLLSAIYFVRLQKLKEGQLIQFPINDDGVNYQFSVVVGKHEKMNTECGKVKTIRLEPKIFGPGQLISRQGEMTMWVTDDNRHLPLRVSAKTAAGNVSAKLLNYKPNCKLIEPPEAAQPNLPSEPTNPKP